MVGWHHQLDGYESEQTPGYSEGQGSLVCCSPQGHKESDTTQQLIKNNTWRLVDLSLSSLSKLAPLTHCSWWTLGFPPALFFI